MCCCGCCSECIAPLLFPASNYGIGAGNLGLGYFRSRLAQRVVLAPFIRPPSLSGVAFQRGGHDPAEAGEADGQSALARGALCVKARPWRADPCDHDQLHQQHPSGQPMVPPTSMKKHRPPPPSRTLSSSWLLLPPGLSPRRNPRVPRCRLTSIACMPPTRSWWRPMMTPSSPLPPLSPLPAPLRRAWTRCLTYSLR